MSNSKSNPFGVKDKIGYMLGDIGNDFTFLFASIYVMIFYSKVMGIRVGLIGTMFVLARCLDAFTDIGMGRIVDRSKMTPNGRIKPWIIRMSGPVAIAGFLMYQSVLSDAPYWIRVTYMFVTYFLWGSVFYTSINIPYGSMASVISEDPKDRSSLSVFRSIGGTLAGIFISIVAPLVIYYRDVEGNQAVDSKKFTIIAGVFSALAVLAYLGCYFLCTERVTIQKERKRQKRPWKDLKVILSSRALLGIVLSAILMLFASLMGQGINNYVFADYFKNTKALSISGLLTLPVALILALCSTRLATRYGKKECGVVGMLFSGVAYLVIGFLHIQNVWLFLGLVFVATLGMYFFMMQSYALVTDVIDELEVKSGKREDGTVYGIYSFSRKIGQAIAGGMSGWALAAIGYDELAVAQTEEVVNGIYYIATIFPGVIYVLCALTLGVVYPLSKERVDTNVEELKKRRMDA